MEESAPCINDFLTDDELLTILSKLERQDEKDWFGLVCKRWCKIQSAERRRLCVPPGPARLRRLLARFSRLTHLDMSQSLSRSFYPGVTDSDLDSVADSVPHLRLLHLKNCKAISDAGLAAIGNGLPSLESLDVSNCRKLTDKGFAAVASGCRNLRSLYLTGCRLVTDSLLQTLFENCLKLEELGLASCFKITDSGLTHLSEGPRNIRTIDVSKCTNVGDLGVGKIISTSGESLVSVKLLDCSKVTDVTVFALAKSCPNLEVLVIGGCSDVTDESLRAVISSCGKNIRSLRLNSCEKLTDLSLNSVISNCENLVALDIGCCDKVTDITFKTLITNDFVSKLKVLKASRVGFTLMGVHIISEFCKGMEYIDLRSCPHISRFVYDIADIRFPRGCKVNFDSTLSDTETMDEMYF
ncbi:F-box/LRR-repeat protein 2 [Rhynchospora pubera]|uniref:F-box/LRR-repeat protein 2 n=1 Tax=Rhynchospora pubera TaxID=906938 RepID=A0AAV8H2H5_9POAL|nr:F-box/LRR-repeat protein 2 [Rhynchospora pubera]